MGLLKGGEEVKKLIKKIVHYALGRHKILSREEFAEALKKTREKRAVDIFNIVSNSEIRT